MSFLRFQNNGQMGQQKHEQHEPIKSVIMAATVKAYPLNRVFATVCAVVSQSSSCIVSICKFNVAVSEHRLPKNRAPTSRSRHA
mmetsp:Transcript_25326/g.45148  ORF Transcript_25326/g.45148 Transcript_25326/m.45148 type:complete len:84 (+) Transcript_25326:200-451(+)